MKLNDFYLQGSNDTLKTLSHECAASPDKLQNIIKKIKTYLTESQMLDTLKAVNRDATDIRSTNLSESSCLSFLHKSRSSIEALGKEILCQKTNDTDLQSFSMTDLSRSLRLSLKIGSHELTKKIIEALDQRKDEIDSKTLIIPRIIIAQLILDPSSIDSQYFKNCRIVSNDLFQILRAATDCFEYKKILENFKNNKILSSLLSTNQFSDILLAIVEETMYHIPEIQKEQKREAIKILFTFPHLQQINDEKLNELFRSLILSKNTSLLNSFFNHLTGKVIDITNREMLFEALLYAIPGHNECADDSDDELEFNKEGKISNSSEIAQKLGALFDIISSNFELHSHNSNEESLIQEIKCAAINLGNDNFTEKTINMFKT